MTITSFTDLKAWQESHKFVLMIYQYTKKFPREEIFALTQQLQKAGVSISSNIAEGFSRNTKNDKAHFYHIALGSLTETQNQILIARDIGYLLPEEYEDLKQQSITASKLLNGLIKSALARSAMSTVP